MKITNRIEQYLDAKGITKYKFSKDLKLSNSFLDKSREITTDKYAIILAYLKGVNQDWLLTGEGEMLKQEEEMVVSGCNIIGNNSNITHQVEDNNKEIRELQDKVKDLSHEVELLKKDKQILNLELVNMSNVVEKLKEKGRK